MDNNDILFELGFSLGSNHIYGPSWRKASVDDLPPSMREWAHEQLVAMMREHNQPCGVWKVRNNL